MSAPHLPPATCSVPLRRRLQRVPMIVLFTLLAVLSSIAVSLSVVSHFSFSPITETRIVVAGTSNKDQNTLDPTVVRDVREKTVTLLDITKKNFESYGAGALLGQAALLSTDGWAVTAAVLPNTLANMRAVDAQGKLYIISEQRMDVQSGVRYIKIAHDGFRIFDVLGEVPATDMTVPVFAFDRLHVSPLLLSLSTLGERPVFTFAQARLVLQTEPTLQTASVLVNDRGVLTALTTAEGVLVSGPVIRHGLPSVLSKKAITKATLPYTFSQVMGIQKDDQLVPISGYLVTKIQPKKQDEVLRVGDIITRIDNAVVSEKVLALLAYDLRQQVPVTVYRDGVEVDVVVSLVK